MQALFALPLSESFLRVGIFVLCFTGFALAELRWPRRRQHVGRWQRWPSNLGLVVLSTVCLRVLLPLGAVGAAAFAAANGVGFLNRFSLPFLADALIGFIALDLAIYFQHRAFHRVPWLWRLHRMHHADLELDVSSGLRFHPLEILLSMGYKMGVVVALGIAPGVVLAFEVLLNALAIFNHANLALPARVDARCRAVLVTPDMHRIHHSTVPDETDSNFGFNLTWWDRLFRTYREKPIAGQLGMTIGLQTFRSPRWLRLDRLLLLPFVDDRSHTESPAHEATESTEQGLQPPQQERRQAR